MNWLNKISFLAQGYLTKMFASNADERPSETVGWAKAQRAHHFKASLMMDGGHGARAPLPTLRFDRRYPASRAFRIVASTISAARMLGVASPVDMVASILAKASV